MQQIFFQIFLIVYRAPKKKEKMKIVKRNNKKWFKTHCKSLSLEYCLLLILVVLLLLLMLLRLSMFCV